MMDLINYEAQFVQNYKEAERLIVMGDYANAIEHVRIAGECCKKLYEESKDARSREKWKNNAEGLQRIYQNCKGHLQDQEPTNKTGGSNNKNAKPQAKQAEKKSELKGETKKTYDNINYVANGIDVKGFLETSANDDVTFDDVCGMEEEKKLISREFFVSEEKKRFRREYLKKDNKNLILLYGVPGTGKTYFAKAVSNELKKRSNDVEIPFFCVKCAALLDSKVGGTENNIIAIFEFASQFEQCVLFLDELDAIVPDRNKDTGDPTAKGRVTTFIQLVNGFSSSNGTLVIGATNFPELLDGAVISRVDEKVEVPLPTTEVIKKMLERKIGSIIDGEIDLNELSNLLEGYSSRDVDHFVSKLKDYLDDLFKEENNSNFNDYRVNPEMVKAALKKVKKSTKMSDLVRIKLFKEGE